MLNTARLEYQYSSQSLILMAPVVNVQIKDYATFSLSVIWASLGICLMAAVDYWPEISGRRLYLDIAPVQPVFQSKDC